MPAVTMTTFLDFVCKSGTPKMTVVRTWKHKGDYAPEQDFYKYFRERVVQMHKQNEALSVLTALPNEMKHQLKREHYPELVNGYKKWRGKRSVKWFEPPSALWQFQGLEVTVNPELGLEVDGSPHIIKLYMKGEKLTKNRVDLITNLMALTCAKKAPKHCALGVLDVRRSKLFALSTPDPLLVVQLEGEAAYWCHVFDNV